MLLLLSLVLPCLGPQADESGGDSVRGLSPLNSRCSHTETGRLFGGQSKVGVRRLRGREDWAHLVWSRGEVPDVQVAISVYISAYLVHLFLGVCVHISLHFRTLLTLHPGTVALGVDTASSSSGWFLPSPDRPPPLASSPILGSTDPSRRLIAGAVAAIFSLSAPLPSPTKASWGSGEDRLSLGSLTGWGSEEKGEPGIIDRCRATPWDMLGSIPPA